MKISSINYKIIIRIKVYTANNLKDRKFYYHSFDLHYPKDRNPKQQRIQNKNFKTNLVTFGVTNTDRKFGAQIILYINDVENHKWGT